MTGRLRVTPRHAGDPSGEELSATSEISLACPDRARHHRTPAVTSVKVVYVASSGLSANYAACFFGAASAFVACSSSRFSMVM
jgi:hypothetical protein